MLQPTSRGFRILSKAAHQSRPTRLSDHSSSSMHRETAGAAKRAYYVGAARIADKLHSGFPRGPYDDNVALITASVASANSYDILTSAAQVMAYAEMKCEAFDLETWIAE